jgi:hypothetical protein
LVEWIKKYIREQAEYNPMVMPLFSSSIGWRWYWRIYFSIGLLYIVDVTLEFTTGFNILWRHSPIEQNTTEGLNSSIDWVIYLFFFYNLFSLFAFISQVSQSRHKLEKEKKISPRFKSLKSGTPHKNSLSPAVGLLLFCYFFLDIFSLVDKGFDLIPTDFEEVERYLKFPINMAILIGVVVLMRRAILWLDKQKPIIIYLSLGGTFFLYLWYFSKLGSQN